MSERAVALVIDALQALAVPHMLVGSFSSNFYGIPRSTRDADFVVPLGAVPITDLAERLGGEFQLDPQMSFEGVTGTCRYIFHFRGTPFEIEFFLLGDDPHDQERFRRRRPVRFLDRDTFLPTVEDVIITKLRWYLLVQRGKDRDDVRNVLSVQAGHLDWDYVNRWCDLHGTRDLLEQIRRTIPPV